jgi:hypothetical protein
MQYNREAEHRLPEVELLIDGLDNRDVEQVRTSDCIPYTSNCHIPIIQAVVITLRVVQYACIHCVVVVVS